MTFQKLWAKQLEELVQKHGNNPRYFWKILHLMKLKYAFPISCRGASPNDIIHQIVTNKEYKNKLSERDREIIMNMILKGSTEIDERKKGVKGGLEINDSK